MLAEEEERGGVASVNARIPNMNRAESCDGEAELEYDVDDALDAIGFGRFQINLLLLCGFFLAADAMEMMLMSFLGPTLRCVWGISAEQEAFLTTVVFAGMLFGTYFWGFLGDRIGRRRTLLMVALSAMIFGLASSVAPSYEWLLISRALVGWSLGGFGVGFTYLMEVLPRAERGKWGIVIEMWWVVGTLFGAALAWITLPSGPTGWRLLLALSALPLLVVTCSFSILPASPRFLLFKGKTEQAQAVMEQASRRNKKALPPGRLVGSVSNRSVSDGVVDEADVSMSVVDSLKAIVEGPLLRTSLLLWFIWFVVALCYYGVVLMTTAQMLNNDKAEEQASQGLAGVGTISTSPPTSETVGPNNSTTLEQLTCDATSQSPFSASDYSSVFVAALAEAPGIICAMLMVDRYGRRVTQSVLLLGGAVSLLLMTTYEPDRSLDTIFLFFARALVEGAFVTTFLFTPEVYPTKVRTTAFGVANSFGRIGGMLSPFLGQDLIEQGKQHLVQVVFGSLCLAAAVAALLLNTETSGGKMDGIDDSQEMWKTSGSTRRRNSELEMVADVSSDAGDHRYQVRQDGRNSHVYHGMSPRSASSSLASSPGNTGLTQINHVSGSTSGTRGGRHQSEEMTTLELI